MKKIIVSLSVIAIVAGVAFGATGAFFTDTETSEDNIIKTGELNIALDGDGSEDSAYFNVDNMIPGATRTACLVIKNPSNSIDSLFRVYADRKNQTSGMRNQLEVTARLIGSKEDLTDGGPCEDMGLSDAYTWYGPGGATTIEEKIKLADLEGPDNALHNIEAANGGWPLEPLHAAVYELEVQMDKNAGDEYQDAFWKGDLVVEATQFANQDRGSDGDLKPWTIEW